jgi:hypothetical protein
VAVEERLPPGAAAALLNRAHSSTDLVMFVVTVRDGQATFSAGPHRDQHHRRETPASSG